jgi:hypothetical protein
VSTESVIGCLRAIQGMTAVSFLILALGIVIADVLGSLTMMD